MGITKNDLNLIGEAYIDMHTEEVTGYERKIYMLGLSVMNRLKREDLRVDEHADPFVLDIIYDAIDLSLIEVNDKGELIFQ